jgi:hypothetical protein
MRARAGEVRMITYMWRAVDPEGNLAAVTGDAHRVEAMPGTGRVHIARGYDALNPDRGLPAIVQTARHEFAHLNGSSQVERWGLDEAARLAAECGRPDGPRARRGTSGAQAAEDTTWGATVSARTSRRCDAQREKCAPLPGAYNERMRCARNT